jgi:Cation transport protein
MGELSTTMVSDVVGGQFSLEHPFLMTLVRNDVDTLVFLIIGFTLTPDSMISFQQALFPLLLGSFLIIAG